MQHSEYTAESKANYHELENTSKQSKVNLVTAHTCVIGTNASFAAKDVPVVRHTRLTLLLKLGEQPKVVQERLGHKDISVTMDMYTHVTMTLQKQTAETFGAMMEQKTVD
ncbi:tyrosine-type recombinase/integrase [Exiguobacterium aurantiacum]|uniref:Tyrosine-type recombinase/integrase n=1 Tax=Exiguobacterium aurantiacum TaxID=33987 RepID=A0ABY5FJM4_9BACL|nr:tyrosine-type recombinase/integrase [Exiguobacterium aurantiacum]UTT41564.1 tyrosine-type recombinase/integrase [Exiguobacterium aurantiacum]